MIQVIHDEIMLNLEENEAKNCLADWKKIKNLRDWMSL